MAFAFFRVLMAALAISILVHTLVYVVTDVGLGFYMIYFTNWVVVVNALYFTLAAVTTLMAVCTGPRRTARPSCGSPSCCTGCCCPARSSAR